MYLCLFLVIHALLAYNIDWDYHGYSACPPESFFGTVGDFNVTKKNFKDVLAQHPHLLIIASSSGCRECCNYERILRNFREEVFNNPSQNYNMTVKIGRLDVIHEPWFNSQYPLQKIPEMIYFHRGVALYLQDRLDAKSIMFQIYKRETIFEKIDTEAHFLDFVTNDPSSLYFRQKLLLGVNLDPDYMQDFQRIATGSNFRLDMKYGIINNRTLSKDLKSKYLLGNTLGSDSLAPSSSVFNLKAYGFQNFANNTVYLVHFPVEYEQGHKVYEFDDASELDFATFFTRKSYESVEQLTPLNREHLFMRGNVIMLAFFDRKMTRQNHDLVSALRQIAFGFPGLTIAWAYWQDYKIIARSVGIFNCIAPCMSIVLTNQDTTVKTKSVANLQFTYDNVYLVEDNVEKDFDGLTEFFRRLMLRDVAKGLTSVGAYCNDNYQKFIETFAVEEMDYHYLKNKAVKNDKDIAVLFVRSFTPFDHEGYLRKMTLLRNFFKKIPGIDFVTLVYDLDSENDEFDLTLKTGDVLISTKELKRGKSKYKIFRKMGRPIEIALEILKNKRVRISKDLEFSAEEKSAGITFDAIFEGKY